MKMVKSFMISFYRHGAANSCFRTLRLLQPNIFSLRACKELGKTLSNNSLEKIDIFPWGLFITREGNDVTDIRFSSLFII